MRKFIKELNPMNQFIIIHLISLEIGFILGIFAYFISTYEFPAYATFFLSFIIMDIILNIYIDKNNKEES